MEDLMSDPREMLQTARIERDKAKAAFEKWGRVVAALEDAIGGGRIVDPSHADANDFSAMATPRVAETVLRQAGGPLHVMEMVRLAQARGWRPDLSSQKARTYFVSAMIRTGGKFKNLGKAKYALIGEGRGA
jgi:hypothetical protein